MSSVSFLLDTIRPSSPVPLSRKSGEGEPAVRMYSTRPFRFWEPEGFCSANGKRACSEPFVPLRAGRS
jgi:hypothetical protein